MTVMRRRLVQQHGQCGQLSMVARRGGRRADLPVDKTTGHPEPGLHIDAALPFRLTDNKPRIGAGLTAMVVTGVTLGFAPKLLKKT